jgi:hypothetical protein
VGATALSCTVRITQSSGEVVPDATVTFAPWSEAGASVLAYRPGPASMTLDRATPFDILLVDSGAGDPATMRDLFELRLIEGNLARLLYVIGAEKMRLRRQAAELYAGRSLANATGHALERIGADLGVPRFDTRLTWDETLHVPSIAPEREADAPYRERLGIYRPFLRATRKAALARLGGDVTLAEPNSELLASIRLVSSPGDSRRITYLNYLRSSFLVQPGVPVPDHRLVPSELEDDENAMRMRLADQFEFPAGAYIDPMIARALHRAGA